MNAETIDQQYKPDFRKEKCRPKSEGVKGQPTPLEGLTLRRYLGIEPRNRVQKCITVEVEWLDALPPHADLSFQINLALEHYITKHKGARIAVQGLED
jgi:hypothetical protein